MADLLFYKKAVVLDSEIHKDYKITSVSNDYSFAKDTNSVIISGIEFSEITKEYPIVFSQSEDGVILPVALLGFRDNENLFVDAVNNWVANYRPAYVRRYPFVLAENDDKTEYTVCVDEEYSGFNKENGEILFDDKGEHTQTLSNVISFLKEFQGQHQLTRQFSDKLMKLDLLVEYTAKIEMKQGDQFALGKMMIVSEDKLMKLDDETILELFKSGQMAWIYSHLFSLSNMAKLIDLMATKL
jgi:hypothetical protein